MVPKPIFYLKIKLEERKMDQETGTVQNVAEPGVSGTRPPKNITFQMTWALL